MILKHNIIINSTNQIFNNLIIEENKGVSMRIDTFNNR